MDELMTVKDVIRYVNMVDECKNKLAVPHDDETVFVVIPQETATVAIACLMKFKDIIMNGSVVLNG